MKTILTLLLLTLSAFVPAIADDTIKFNKDNWDIEAEAHVLEHYQGKDAIYLHQGKATLKDFEFLNGTVEFDIFLTKRQSFPGVYFRQFDELNAESFYLRPHLPGKPDANQAVAEINGVAGWQLYFGERYSFAYDYRYDDWTHVKLVVNGDKAQVFLDHATKPNLSWRLKHKPRHGKLSIGGGFAPMHYANFTVDTKATQLVDFKVKEVSIDKNIVPQWTVSDKFKENLLDNLNNLPSLVKSRQWGKTIKVEENNAANISWAVSTEGEGNTVFAKIVIQSDISQTKRFQFGYSDRVVVILNDQPIYRGTNRWRTRDYRYLGTVGLFDEVYLNLKKGSNTLLMAVSEDFGGWGVTGKFVDVQGVKVSN